jgi:predicted extracellular nuclease
VVERDSGNGATSPRSKPAAITRSAAAHRSRPPRSALARGLGTLRGHAPAHQRAADDQRHQPHARFGELATSFGGRLFTPTEIAMPGPAVPARRRDMPAARCCSTMPQRPGSRQRLVPAGSTHAPAVPCGDVTGVLDQHTAPGACSWMPRCNRTPRRARPAPRVAGDLRVASLNLENLFNGDGRGGGFSDPRGARSPAELQLQLGKLVATLHALDPDIAALMELENDGYGRDSSLAQLVAALGPDWRFVDAGQGAGPDEIRVGLVYRASRVAAGRRAGDAGRRALRHPQPGAARAGVQAAEGGAADGRVFIVAANHFKSKGCSEATGRSRSARRPKPAGMPCVPLRRSGWTRGCVRIRHDLSSDLAVIVGDLNAYAHEDPVP